MQQTLRTLGLLWAVFAVQTVVAVAGVPIHALALATPLTTAPWTLLTAVYAHAGVWHLLANSVGLLLAGGLFERLTNATRFHLFFAGTGVLSGVTQVVVSSLLFSPVQVVGASGAIFAVCGYVIAGNSLSQGVTARVNFARWQVAGVFALVATVGTLLTAAPHVALVGHGTGLFIGLLAGHTKLAHN